MKNINQNNERLWVRKLREYEEVGYRATSKEALLKKFRERREQTPVRKKVAGWYWMAAACMVLFFAIRFLIFTGREVVPADITHAPAVIKQNKVPVKPVELGQRTVRGEAPAAASWSP